MMMVCVCVYQELERDLLELAIYPYAYNKLRQFYPMSPGDQRPELSVSHFIR